MAWGGHENWAADRGCHAATCSWKEIPRKHGCIHGRSSPNPAPAQVTKPVPRRIGGTQAHKLLLRGFNLNDRKSCRRQTRSGSVRAHAVHVEISWSSRDMQLARTSHASEQICHHFSIPHEGQRPGSLDRERAFYCGLRVMLPVIMELKADQGLPALASASFLIEWLPCKN
jgi:hypothetical protein